MVPDLQIYALELVLPYFTATSHYLQNLFFLLFLQPYTMYVKKPFSEKQREREREGRERELIKRTEISLYINLHQEVNPLNLKVYVLCYTLILI